MFRKLVIASAVLALSSGVAFAGNYKGDYKGEAPCPTYTFGTGPYVGFSVGPRVNLTGTPTSYVGLEGTLSAGYGAMLAPNFYLAGEILVADSANLKDFEYTQPGLNTQIGSRSSWSYGLSVLPGVMINDHVLGYVRLGVIRTRFSDQGSNNTGGQIGLGAQTNVYQNWDLRGEYVYSQYNSVSGIGKPMSHQFNLGVVYKFI